MSDEPQDIIRTPLPSWLQQSLASEDEEERIRAIEASARFRHTSVYSMLAGLLEDPSASIRQQAGRVLADAGEESLETLVATLARSTPPARVMAARLLGRIGDPGALFSLVRALTDAEPTVRASAARALQRVATPQAVPALRRALDDPDKDVRKNAQRALKRLGAEP